MTKNPYYLAVGKIKRSSKNLVSNAVSALSGTGDQDLFDSSPEHKTHKLGVSLNSSCPERQVLLELGRF